MAERPEVSRQTMYRVGAAIGLVGALSIVGLSQPTEQSSQVLSVEQGPPVSSQKQRVTQGLAAMGLSLEKPTTTTTYRTFETRPPTSTTTTTQLAERNIQPRVSRSANRSTTTPVTVVMNKMKIVQVLLPDAPLPKRNYLGCVANLESGGHSDAYNPDGPYFGKYQYLQSTFDGFVPNAGYPELKGVNILMVPEQTQDEIALAFLDAGRRGEWSGQNRRCQHLLFEKVGETTTTSSTTTTLPPETSTTMTIPEVESTTTTSTTIGV